MSVNVNLGAGVLSTSISSSDTTIVVNVGGSSISEARSVFPTITPFYITIMPSMPTIGISNILNSEIVLVNTASGNSDGTVTLTVTRAKKNTTAKAFSAGDIVANGIYSEEAVSIGDGVATEPSPWIETEDIVNGAVTAGKIDFSTFNQVQKETVAGYGDRFCYKSESGLAIVFRRIKLTGINCTDTLGSCYYGLIDEPISFYSSQVFIEPPAVNVTIGNATDSAGYYYWIMKAEGRNISTTTIPAGAYAICRPTAVSNLTVYLDIIAIGKWK